MRADLLVENAAQVATCAGPGPRRGAAMREVGLVANGAVAVRDGAIVAVGETAELQAAFTPSRRLDVGGRVVTPGFVDPHTHGIYAGDRVAEFELRIQGAGYLKILAAGGGILSTTRATRAATLEDLVTTARPRLDAMLRLGSTTVEVKSGYGLTTADELKMLAAVEELDRTHPVDLVPTFLGAHAVPPEYQGNAGAYVDLVVNDMLPQVQAWYRGSELAARGRSLFVDVFCEANAFDLAQSRRVLEAGLDCGFPTKIHADEFTSLGGAGLAVELGATTADHLDVTPPAEVSQLAGAETVAVILPAVNFNLGSRHYADARALIDAGVAVALATDMNPGSAPCPSMPMVMAIACRYQGLLPAEALNASTLNAAYAIGLGHRLGSIEVGKQADLLVVDAPDYRHLAYQFGVNLVRTVVKKGRIVCDRSW